MLGCEEAEGGIHSWSVGKSERGLRWRTGIERARRARVGGWRGRERRVLLVSGMKIESRELLDMPRLFKTHALA